MNIVKVKVCLGMWENYSKQKARKKIQSKWGRTKWVKVRAAVKEKPEICTADELHYVKIPNTDWRLALWRYLPSPNVNPFSLLELLLLFSSSVFLSFFFSACFSHVGSSDDAVQAITWRNHPLLLLSGVGTNAIGYDLSPQFSFARHMSGQGFDTWILEVRGAGLSMRELESFQSLSKSDQASAGRSQFKDWSHGVSDYNGKVQNSIQLSFSELSEQFVPMVEDFWRQLDLFLNSNWDFDQLLKEDLPLVVDYIQKHSNPNDGKLFSIGHSMGGILLYAMLSLYGFEGRDSPFAAVVTLASSLDYSSSRSSLKLLLPLAHPAEALNIPSIPVGALLSTMHPLAARPPFLLSWLNSQISAQEMMVPELYDKLVLKNFCTVPAKLLLQLATAFESPGLCDRAGTFFYKNHLHTSNVPILALAGDRDLICPPEAVYETVKIIPGHMVTYKVFGEPDGPHYAHYDLVGGRFAAKKVYPCIIDFLSASDVQI